MQHDHDVQGCTALRHVRLSVVQQNELLVSANDDVLRQVRDYNFPFENRVTTRGVFDFTIRLDWFGIN